MAKLSANTNSIWQLARAVFLWTSVSVLAIGGASGCGRSGLTLEKVTGVVRYKGQPVARARVTFHGPATPRAAVGTTNSAGEFTLGTMTPGDGAVVGEYRVSVTTFTPEAIAKMSPAQQELLGRGEKVVGSGVPVRYASLEKSGLSAVVTRGAENRFQFELSD